MDSEKQSDTYEKTWQDVFIQFIQYIKNNPNYDFDLILDNQNDLFSSKYDVISKWSELQPLFEDNSDMVVVIKLLKEKLGIKLKICQMICISFI
jgi:hypothetical protein